MLYKEYIKVESDFIPVFSASSDRTHPERWKSFYPHESFKKILESMIDTLEKGSALKDRPLWISGSYGTGKTFASFVIKHILEDRLEDVEKYFTHHEVNSLWQRVLGVRSKGKILVVHQSSSAGINSQNKLFNTIVESVKRALRENGYDYTGAAGIFEKVLSTLKDSDSTFNFKGAFNKYRGKFLEYSSPEEVISDLETLEGQERLDLLENIVDIAEKESYNWSMSVQNLIDWLRDVREKNNLYAVFFIWDEFTEYFRNNLNNITGLQEIAQNAAELSFYFFLITHSDANQLITDSTQRKIIEARFKISRITLAESTAFQLMAQALSIDSDLKDEWKNITLELWESVQRDAANFIIKRDESIKLDDIKNLLPIHPYAAYLLKFIAQSISSNQRTMFQFLCAADNGTFKNFIDGHGFEYGGDNFLTTDFLWDYFFREDNPDLDKTFLESISHYNNFSSVCKNDNQQRILKTTLILFALQQKNLGGRGGASSLLRSTQKNIFACFAGTPIETEVKSTLNYFADRGIISALEEGNDTGYILATTQIDPDRMENILKQVRSEKSFDAIIKDDNYGVTGKFKPTDYLKFRFDIQIISPTKFLQTSASTFSLEDNQILAFYIFAADEEDQGKVNQTIQKLREKFPERCVIADFSVTPFTKQRYEKFVQNKARELYFKDVPNQSGQVKLAKKSATDLVDEWIRQLAVTTVRIWTSADDSVQISGEGNFFKQLRELNKKFFGDGLEEISINDKLFSTSGLTETVAKYAISGEKVKGSFNSLNLIGAPFQVLCDNGGENYWKATPSHTISKMKLVVDGIIKNGLKKRNEVAFCDIWNALKKPPIGLLKCVGSIFLLGLLLKDYADKNFYIRDVNSNTSTLTSDKLCNLIVNTVKELPGSRDKFIVKQTPEHVKFCSITSDIFNLPKDKINSVDDTAKNIKIYLKKSCYPLWSLKYFIEENYFDAPYKETYLVFLKLLEEFINPSAGHDVTKIADKIFAVYDKNPVVIEELKNIVREENFKTGMTYYIAQYNPDLKKIVGRLKFLESEYLARLNEKLSADSAYLWKVEDVNKQIDNLFDELRLIEAVNPILSAPQKNLSDVCSALGDKLNKIRIPRTVVEEFQPNLKNLFQIFAALRTNSEKNFAQAAEQINQSTQEFTIFFENQFEFFAQALRTYVENQIESKFVEKLFNEVPAGIFFMTCDDFVLQMKRRLQKFRQDEQTDKFFAAWHEVTSTTSPSDWSNKNEIPILCAFQDCLDEAQPYFSALNKTSQLTDNMDSALKFIRGEKLARLSDKEYLNREFVKYFCGDNYAVVVSVEELQKILRRHLGNNVYSWFSNKKNCEFQIKTFAEKNYREKFLSVVREKIRNLSAEEAQKYLEDLIYKDTLLGIRVLKDAQN
ncbi:MAG: hypothetical protein K6G55_03030 [Selenomonadaceae bacterium]|nr:hypothetical protein [Selenomonadaceae bacterium]